MEEKKPYNKIVIVKRQTSDGLRQYEYRYYIVHMPEALGRRLVEVAEAKKYRSLSAFIKDIIMDYLMRNDIMPEKVKP